jgi:hypothetical protein
MKKPYEMQGEELKAYNTGFADGNEGNYFPAGLDEVAYDRGYRDGKQFGPRKGQPWTLAELHKVSA